MKNGKYLFKRFLRKLPIVGKFINNIDSLLQENISIKLENKQLKELSPSISNFQDIFLSPWTDAWKKFNNDHLDETPQLLEKLKSGMDDDSKKVIDTLWEKIIYLIPYNKYKKSFLYKITDFFTEKELEEQKKISKITIDYKFPQNVNIDTTIFTSKNGLIFLPDTVLSQIKNRCIIDGGAYVGDSALAFCEYTPSQIYSFEPISNTYEKLQETITLNKKTDIISPIKYGLSSVAKKTIIYGSNSGASMIVDNEKDNSEEIGTVVLDHFVMERNIQVGLIKLDVEGSELDVIKGSLETIKRDKPILLISIYHRPEDFFYIKPMIENLNLGYTFIVRKTSSFRVTSETVLIGYINK